MRVERRGGVERLTPRVERFLIEALRGISMDEAKSSEARRVDYSCLNGLVAVEIKSLEEDPSGRLNNLTDELREREDWPTFLGSVPIKSIVNQLEDSPK